MKKIGRSIINYLLILLLMTISVAEISFKSQVNRNEIGVNENLVLTVIISGERDIANVNLSDLPDFNVVGSSKMSNISIINGQISKSLESSYTLVPKKEGDLTIPALSVNIGGNKYSTQPIKIKVLGSGANVKGGTGQAPSSQLILPNIYVETTLNKKSYYLGEPMYFKLKVFNRLRLFGQPALKEPEIKNIYKDTKLEVLRSNYQAEAGGKNYMVDEISWVMFASDVGEASVGPASIVYSFSPFEPNREEQSKPIVTTIKELPKYNGQHNHGIGQFSIKAKSSTTQVKVNEGLSFKVILNGQGNLRFATAPVLKLPNDVDIYSPKVTLIEKYENGVLNTSKQYEYLIIPRGIGRFDIPPLKWTYFNPENSSWISIYTEQIKIEVAKTMATNSSINNTGLAINSAINSEKMEVEQEGKDINYIYSELGQDYSLKGQRHKVYLVIVALISVIFLVYRKYALNLLLYFYRAIVQFINFKNLKLADLYDYGYVYLIDAVHKKFRTQGKRSIINIKDILSEDIEIYNNIKYFEGLKFSPALRKPELELEDMGKFKSTLKSIKRLKNNSKMNSE